jgi:DNA repair protein RadC
MSSVERVHRFVAFEQRVLATQPATTDLPTLFREWGLIHSTQERMWVVALDSIANLKTVTEVAVGGFHDVEVHIPAVLAAVIGAHTDQFYLAHNHPSGEVSPTPPDMQLTAIVMKAANAAGLHFQDHIICGPQGWYSFYQAGVLKRADTYGVKAAVRKR